MSVSLILYLVFRLLPLVCLSPPRLSLFNKHLLSDINGQYYITSAEYFFYDPAIKKENLQRTSLLKSLQHFHQNSLQFYLLLGFNNGYIRVIHCDFQSQDLQESTLPSSVNYFQKVQQDGQYA